jgi:transposase
MQAQPMLMPANLEDLIPEGHLVWIVNEMIEELDLNHLFGNIREEEQAPIITRCY